MFSPKSRSLLSAHAPPLPPSPLESASGEFWREYSRLRELQQQTDGVNSLVWARSSDRAARYARERVARLTQEERKKRDDRIAAEEARLRSEEDAKALAAYQAAEERRVAEEDAVRKAVLEAEVARRLAEEAAFALALAAKKREEEEEEEALARVMAEENERKAELAARKKAEAEAEVALAELRHKAEEKAEMERVLKAEAFRVEEAKARVAMEANISKPDKPALQSVVDNSNVSKSLSNYVVTLVYAAEKTDAHRCDNIMVSAMKHEESNSFKHNADEESALLLINLGKKTSLSPPVVCSSPKTLRNSWSSVLTPDSEIVTRSPINVRLPSEMFDYEVNDYLPLILERSMTPISFHLHSQTA